MTTLSKQTRSYLPWLLSSMAVFLILVVAIPFADAALYRDKIYPGVRVGSLELGGKTRAETEAAITTYMNTFLHQPVSFWIGQAGGESTLAPFVTADIPATIEHAAAIGHTGTWITKESERFRARMNGISILPAIAIRGDALNEFLKTIAEAPSEGGAVLSSEDGVAQNAHFRFVFEQNSLKQIITVEAVPGYTLDVATARDTLLEHAYTFDPSPITVGLVSKEPTLHKADLDPLIPDVQALIQRTPPEITWQDKKWTIDAPTFASWITAVQEEGQATLALDKAKIALWLDATAKEIETPPSEPVFELSPDGKKALKFSLGKSGVELPRAENIEMIAAGLLAGTTPILTTKELPPTFTTPQGAEIFGIKELVGEGVTNFRNSPSNRIKNIKRAAALLQGILIAPGEEFSTIKAVSPITLENGYFPEFVIKPAEGKTVKEVGGGLCQIGTTMFRVALNAGLPIVMRANHSYRVSYYEPPIGMDATIYDPLPDLRFINDTGNWLILTTKIEGTVLTFDLWGTKDGRKAVTTDPVVSNFVQPPPSKLIETTELKPGQKKCTEHPHVGSDAKFTYTVTFPDGTVKTKEFRSHYRPWQEVCLIGVAPPEQLSPSPSTVPGDTLPATLPSAEAEGATGNTTTP